VQVHTVVVGGMPGWQIALIAIVASLLAATAAVLAYRAWTIRVRLRPVRP
jgi:LPS O-antigen subunit length determinant protein (WzzB/FepE family)